MDKGKKPFTAHPQTHTHSLKFKDTHRSLQSSPHLEHIPKNPLTHMSKGRPQTQREPHMDKPLDYSEQEEGTKLPQSPGTTKPQTPALHMVPLLLKEHNSQHPKGRDHQQQRTFLKHTTCSDISFSMEGQQSESDKPTKLFFLCNKDLFLLIMPPMP